MSALGPSAYAAAAPAAATARMKAASAAGIDPGFQAPLPAGNDAGFNLPMPGSSSIDPGFSMPSGALASLLAMNHIHGAAGNGAGVTLNVHPVNGITVKTTPATGGTTPVKGAKKPAPKAGPTVGQQISSGDLIDAYNREAQQIPTQVQSIYGPIGQSLADLFGARSQNLQGAINSYAPIYGELLGQYGPTADAAYNEAARSQAAVDSMLQSALGGQGATAAANLAKEIGTTGVAAPVANALESTQAGKYLGEQGAAAARGAASLSQLFGQGANAADYGAKLPGVAGAAGLQATKQLQGQLSNDELSALNSLAQNEGQTSGQLYSDLRNMLNNMGMIEMYYGPRGAAAQTTAGANVTKANAYAGPYAGAAVTKANAAQTTAGANVTKANAATTNANANATRAGADVTKANAYATKTKSGPAPTSSSLDKFWNGAYYGVQPKYYQGQPVAGTGVPPLTYGQAITRAVAMGQSRQAAINRANSMYKPGEGGRPAITAKQQKNIRAALPPDPMANILGGNDPFLKP